MAKILNHINTYADLTAYNNDTNKDYPNVSYIVEDDIVLFDNEVKYEEQYFTIESLEDNNKIWFNALSFGSYTPTAKTISVSTDGGTTWTEYQSDWYGTIIATLNTGEKVLIKGNNDSYSDGTNINNYYYNNFNAKKTFDVKGNVMSLIYGDDFNEQYAFPSGKYNLKNLFYHDTKLVSAENLILPATELRDNCYSGMFYGCTSLTKAPELPAQTLTEYCYYYMFEGCTSLTMAPELTATVMRNWCYANMFKNCTSLTTAPVLTATTLAVCCYNGMFYGCTSLTTAPELTAETLANYCYEDMFRGCTSLTTAPELPATTLAVCCYHNMFYGCTSLTTAPELPATTLTTGCYDNMFRDCTSLNYIKAMFTTEPTTNYTSYWVEGVSATGTFVKNSEATWNVTGIHGIPTGWTVETEHAKINKKYRATYTNGTTVDGECDGNNLVKNEVTKSGLKTVVIGECVPAIVGECFSDCADLTSVIIEGNTSIDHYSFARNNGHLTSITMYSTTPPPCKSTAFTYFNGSSYVPMTSITIYVPAASVNAYKNASGWSKYSDKIRAIS